MVAPLDRQDLIDGLREVIRRARPLEFTGISIRIVGGAALQIAYFERATTYDIDAQIQPLDHIAPLVEEIGRERGWPSDWLNNKAAMFIPSWGREVEWEPLFDDATISISVAPVDALLAMKLKAARPGRDTDDIVQLLALNEVDAVGSAEALFESFYPGDALQDRTIALLEQIFERGLPPKPTPPPRAEFT